MIYQLEKSQVKQITSYQNIQWSIIFIVCTKIALDTNYDFKYFENESMLKQYFEPEINIPTEKFILKLREQAKFTEIEVLMIIKPSDTTIDSSTIFLKAGDQKLVASGINDERKIQGKFNNEKLDFELSIVGLTIKRQTYIHQLFFLLFYIPKNTLLKFIQSSIYSLLSNYDVSPNLYIFKQFFQQKFLYKLGGSKGEVKQQLYFQINIKSLEITLIVQDCVLQNDNGSCRNCKEKFYIDKGLCKQCSQNCNKCDSFNNCLICALGSNKKGQCLDECGLGFYKNTSPSQPQSVCDECLNNCKECQNNYQCLSCKEGFMFQSDQKCVKDCEIGFIKTSDPNRVGIKSTDTNQKYCAACYKTSDGKCVESCPSQTYLEQQTSLCKKCSTNNCNQCNQSNICTSCVQDYFLNQNNECMQCQEGQYFDQQKKICLNCPDKKCKQCSSQSNGKICIQCYEYYQFDQTSKVCLFDDQSYLIECSNPDNCEGEKNIVKTSDATLSIISIINTILLLVSFFFFPLGPFFWYTVQIQQQIGNFILIDNLRILSLGPTVIKIFYSYNLFSLIPDSQFNTFGEDDLIYPNSKLLSIMSIFSSEPLKKYFINNCMYYFIILIISLIILTIVKFKYIDQIIPSKDSIVSQKQQNGDPSNNTQSNYNQKSNVLNHNLLEQSSTQNKFISKNDNLEEQSKNKFKINNKFHHISEVNMSESQRSEDQKNEDQKYKLKINDKENDDNHEENEQNQEHNESQNDYGEEQNQNQDYQVKQEEIKELTEEQKRKQFEKQIYQMEMNAYKKRKRLLQIMDYNYFIRFQMLFGNYLLLSLAISFKQLTLNTTIDYIDLGVKSMFSLIYVILLVYLTKKIFVFQEQYIDFIEDFPRYYVLFRSIKRYGMRRFFWILLEYRKIIQIGVLIFLSNKIISVSVIILTNILFLIFIAHQKPVANITYQKFIFLIEILVIISNANILGYIISPDENLNTKFILSLITIIILTILNVIVFGFLIMQVYMFIKFKFFPTLYIIEKQVLDTIEMRLQSENNQQKKVVKHLNNLSNSEIDFYSKEWGINPLFVQQMFDDAQVAHQKQVEEEEQANKQKVKPLTPLQQKKYMIEKYLKFQKKVMPTIYQQEQLKREQEKQHKDRIKQQQAEVIQNMNSSLRFNCQNQNQQQNQSQHFNHFNLNKMNQQKQEFQHKNNSPPYQIVNLNLVKNKFVQNQQQIELPLSMNQSVNLGYSPPAFNQSVSSLHDKQHINNHTNQKPFQYQMFQTNTLANFFNGSNVLGNSNIIKINKFDSSQNNSQYNSQTINPAQNMKNNFNQHFESSQIKKEQNNFLSSHQKYQN